MDIDRKKQLDILDALTDALGRSDSQSTEEIKEELRDDGIDVDGALNRLIMAQKNIAMAAKRSVLNTAREKRLKLAEQGHKFIGRFKDWTKEEIVARIKELGGPEAGFAYRDLESMGADEMASLLEDLEMTKARSREDDPNAE